MVKIYALTDPRDGRVRYVGKTVKPLEKRRLRHVSDIRCGRGSRPRRKWIGELLDEGLDPEIGLIEECDEDTWAERERFWIAYYRAYGNGLTNVQPGGRSGKPGVSMPAHVVEEMSARMEELWDNPQYRRKVRKQHAREGPVEGKKYKGVRRVEHRISPPSYYAQARYNGEADKRGPFESAEEAAAMYNILALEYHGEGCYLNPVSFDPEDPPEERDAWDNPYHRGEVDIPSPSEETRQRLRERWDEPEFRHAVRSSLTSEEPKGGRQYKGVRRIENKTCPPAFYAIIAHNGDKQKHGPFESAEDAAAMYNILASDLHPDGCYLNPVPFDPDNPPQERKRQQWHWWVESDSHPSTKRGAYGDREYKGVYERKSGSFRAQISHDGERHGLGTHKSKLMAAIIRDLASLEYQGPGAYLNVLSEANPKGLYDSDDWDIVELCRN